MQLSILNKTKNRVTTKDEEGVIREVVPRVYHMTKRLGFPKFANEFKELLVARREGAMNAEDFVAAAAAVMEIKDECEMEEIESLGEDAP